MTDPGTKFGRNYTLKVETQPRVPGRKAPSDASFATIGPPFSVDFSITRNLLPSSNVATFRIRNLAERSRDRIYKDQFQSLDYRAIQFWAGYTDTPPLVFNGSVKQILRYFPQ